MLAEKLCTWASDRFFPARAIVDFSRVATFFPGKAKNDEAFYPLETKKTTYFDN